ncbi:aspartyl/asparaginyl beta-hydroxylase domain-containing protein [Comamonas sp. JC664]|uniref:aspartyl/asparaginyl beta-hydroxylase domain-containing protein n=1 Tax=Comamonas sp. JC664 TaxID=2801917 RepID=UPI0036126C00
MDAYTDCEALQALPAIAELLRSLDLQCKSVRLMRLQPDSEIMEHTDAGLCAAEGDARLHIPLQTEEKVFFHLGWPARAHARGRMLVHRCLPAHRVRNRSARRASTWWPMCWSTSAWHRPLQPVTRASLLR